MAFDLENIWNGEISVFLTSFWGWSPETWGMVSFATKGRRDNVLTELSDPFIALIYVTKTAPNAPDHIRGKVTGFFLVSHQKKHRNDLTHTTHHGRYPDKWRFGLKALRAFTFLPEYQMVIDDFDLSISTEKRSQSVGTHGEILKELSKWRKLKDVPFQEVDCFNSERKEVISIGHDYLNNSGMVRAGTINRSGYYVSANSANLPRQLYVLKLEGSVDTYLGRDSNNQSIYKIGLSISPEMRRSAFQKALPRGVYRWIIEMTTHTHNNGLQFNYNAAVVGETRMKKHLAKNGEWLGGEFYLATDHVIRAAWEIGCEVAEQSERSKK